MKFGEFKKLTEQYLSLECEIDELIEKGCEDLPAEVRDRFGIPIGLHSEKRDIIIENKIAVFELVSSEYATRIEEKLIEKQEIAKRLWGHRKPDNFYNCKLEIFHKNLYKFFKEKGFAIATGFGVKSVKVLIANRDKKYNLEFYISGGRDYDSIISLKPLFEVNPDNISWNEIEKDFPDVNEVLWNALHEQFNEKRIKCLRELNEQKVKTETEINYLSDYTYIQSMIEKKFNERNELIREMQDIVDTYDDVQPITSID